MNSMLTDFWARNPPSAAALQAATRAFFACRFGTPFMAVSCPEVAPPWGKTPHWVWQYLHESGKGFAFDADGALREKGLAVRRQIRSAGSPARAAANLERWLRREVVFACCGFVAEQIVYGGVCEGFVPALERLRVTAPVLRGGHGEFLRLVTFTANAIQEPENLARIWKLGQALDEQGAVPAREVETFLPSEMVTSSWPPAAGTGPQCPVGFWRADYPFEAVEHFQRRREAEPEKAEEPGQRWARLLRAFRCEVNEGVTGLQ